MEGYHDMAETGAYNPKAIYVQHDPVPSSGAYRNFLSHYVVGSHDV